MSVRYRIVKRFPAYRVGTDGSVWSRWMPGNNPGPVMGSKWKRLTLLEDDQGRQTVILCHYGIQRRMKVGHLVLDAFVGPRPKGMECCHDPDSDPRNNRVENIRWDTHKGNGRDMVRHGIHSRGSKRPLAKLTESDIPKILDRLARGESQRSIADKFKVSQSAISLINTGKYWKHINRKS